jgi:hypothetical protein
MPNWCDNSVTLYHEDKSKIDALAEEMEKKNATNQSMACPFQHLHPRPEDQEENWYDWNVNNWGTKWEASIIDWSRDDDNTITIYFESAWSPPIALYDYLTDNDWDVNALYHEPGMGYAGMYNNGSDEYYEYNPADKDSIDSLPSDVIDFAGLENAHNEYVTNLLEEEWGDAERTEWIEAKTSPILEGWYEVSTTSWEFPHFMQFVNGEWDCYDPTCVKQWRGLANNPNV